MLPSFTGVQKRCWGRPGSPAGRQGAQNPPRRGQGPANQSWCTSKWAILDMFSVHHLIGPTFHQFWDSFSRTLGVMKVGCRPETHSISMGSPTHSLSPVMGQMFNNLGAFQMDEILYFAYGCLPLVQRCSQLIWISLRWFWQCHKQLLVLGLVYG